MENITSYDALFDSMTMCMKGVRWKPSVGYFVHNYPTEIRKLSDDLNGGRYRQRSPRYFTIHEPKEREIMSINFRDRVFQRALNDNGIYPATSKSYIYDNYACQKGKGTDKARNRLAGFLRKYYRHHGTTGYALKIDIKGYYPNMSHRVAEDVLKKHIPEDVFNLAYQNVLKDFEGDYGYNAGSQIVQIIGVTALNELDHYIKERLRAKFYLRYMDDLVLIHHDKAYLEYCLEEIKQKLSLIEMEVNDKKTYIQKITKPIRFLGFNFRLTETGKVVILANPEKIRREKRKLYRMVKLCKQGKLSRSDIDVHFKSFKASVSYGDSWRLIQSLNKYYHELWKGQKNENQNQKD